MKIRGVFGLLGLALFSYFSSVATGAGQPLCSRYTVLPNRQVPCPRIADPVCSSDGVTYSNECLFCREILRGNNIVKKHDGRCVQVDCTGYVKTPTGQEAACTLEYSPICGTDGVTYGNKCAFCSAVANGADIDQNNDEECPQNK